MSQLPLITTIIPTFNRAERLKKAIQSVLSQTYLRFQVWIYDDASQDDTAAVVAELSKDEPRVKYYRHENNIGAEKNFQYGLSKIETPFFSFLSDDDYLLPEFYATALDGFARYPDIGFSSGAVIDVDGDHKIIDVALARWPNNSYYPVPNGLLEIIGKYSNWIGTVFRKEVIEKNGPLDLNLKANDIDYVLRAAQHFSFAISKKPVAVFVQHSSSFSTSNGFKLIWPGWDILMSKIRESATLSSEIKMLAEKKLRADLQKLLIINALKNIENKNFDQVSPILCVYKKMDYADSWIPILNTVTRLCKSVPFLHSVFFSLIHLRRLWKKHIRKAAMLVEYKKYIVLPCQKNHFANS